MDSKEQLTLFDTEEIEELTQEEIWKDLDSGVPERRLRVELLSDDRGVFGVGTVNGNEFERRLRLVTRPDRVVDYAGAYIANGWCALQPVPRPHFCHTVEGDLVQMLLRSMMGRHGLLEDNGFNVLPWSAAPDPKRARQVYHGLKIKSLKIVNSLIRKALDVADQRALLAARRFPIRYRAQLYEAFCLHGERAIQLCETFPLLSVVLFGGDWSQWESGETLEDYEVSKRRFEMIQKEQIDLVLRGVKLRRIADSLAIPYALRRVTPRATKYVRKTKLHDVAKYIPPTTGGQRVFFAAIRVAESRDGQPLNSGFKLWAARQAANMTYLREFTDIEDIKDWVQACQHNDDRVPDQRGKFLTRRFSPDMSLRTVRRLCEEWHEAIASNMTEGELVKFPEPWIDGAEFGGHRIVPVTDSQELYLASKRLHNCASEYVEAVVGGYRYLYTVTNGNGIPAVMVEIYREGNVARLGQVKGYCNATAPKEIEMGVRRWFSRMERQTKLSGPANERRSEKPL